MMWLGLLLALTMQTPVATVVARDMMSNVDEPKEVVAQTDAEWAALWKQHAGDKPAPKVDLTTRTVVAVFLGSRTSAGFEAEIIGVKKDGPATVIEWQEKRPGAGGVAAMIITSPALIATVPKFAGPVHFKKVEK